MIKYYYVLGLTLDLVSWRLFKNLYTECETSEINIKVFIKLFKNV